MVREVPLAAATGNGEGRFTSRLGRVGTLRSDGNLRGAGEAALRSNDFGAIGRPGSASAAEITGIAPLRLRLTLPVEALIVGINTLTVTVLDGDASRRRSVSVSFLVPEPGNLRNAKPSGFRLPDTLRDAVAKRDFGGAVPLVRSDRLKDALAPAAYRASMVAGRSMVTVAARTRLSHAVASPAGTATASGAQARPGLRPRSERFSAVAAAAERLAAQDGAVLHHVAKTREATALIHGRREARDRQATALLDAVGRVNQRVGA
jgi:hypothetical protein